MQQTNQALNDTARTNYDKRNEEARLHEGHHLHVLRSRHIDHPLNSGCDELTVICETCKKQYKAYVWGEK